ncbi:MAG: plastocyanin/azurin family copper-binding protein [Chloroflexota bacterium]|nr:plastocyanin/azurin family copper-binding protein [Chloroflexota bacterium]
MTGPRDERTRQRPVDRRSLLQRLVSLGGMCLAVPVVAGCEILAARDDDRYTVHMTNDREFAPASLTVPLGSTVVWENQTDRRHAVTTDASHLEEGAPVALPASVAPFTSPDLFTGETWQLRFTQPGTYVYACPYHYQDNMIGSIAVEE